MTRNMKKHHNLKSGLKSLGLIIILIMITNVAFAQKPVDISVAMYNRYVWRGFDFGNSPSIQPDFSVNTGNFGIGVWGSFAFFGNPTYSETDLYASYSIPIQKSSLSLGVTDYYFPYATPNKYFDFKNSHTYEANVIFTGPSSFPLTVSGNINFAGSDKDNSMYLELDYPVSIVTFTFGMLPYKSSYYGTNKAAVVNVGVSTTKDLTITSSFKVPLTGSVIVDPYTKNIFLLAGISL